MIASEPIRIGFIGCGNITHSHMQAIQRIPEIEIVAGADIQIDRAYKFVREAGAEAYFADWRQMLEEVGLDAIDQCIPHTLPMEPTLVAAGRTHQLARHQSASSGRVAAIPEAGPGRHWRRIAFAASGPAYSQDRRVNVPLLYADRWSGSE